jgi:hypothetical protein
MRRLTRRFALLVLCVPLFIAPATTRADAPGEPEIWRAAGSWLALLDARSYAESWTEASRIFQRAVPAEGWADRAAALRLRSGNPISRELTETLEVTDPPGVPAGAYVRLRFEFECSTAGVLRETLLMVNEGRRGWRVAAYAVGPKS